MPDALPASHAVAYYDVVARRHDAAHTHGKVAWKSPLQDYVVQDTEGGWHPTRPAQLVALDQFINETGIHVLYTGMTAIGLRALPLTPAADTVAMQPLFGAF